MMRIRKNLQRWIDSPVVWAVLGPLILFGPALVTGKVLFWGTPALQFIPWWVEGWNQIQHGVFPLWNQLNGMGAPLLANYQSAFLYPPNWSLFVFAAGWGAAGVAWGYTLLSMLHLIWGGVGMVTLLRRMGASNLSQAVGGAAFALCGYLIGRMEFFSMIWAAAWLPWIIRYASELASPVGEPGAAYSAKIKVNFGLVLCFALQFLAGHAQLAWYSALLAGLWVLVGALRTRMPRAVIFLLLNLGVAAALAGLLAAAQLLPTAEYLGQSQRSTEVGYNDAVVYSFWPWRLVTLVAPDFFGNPGRGDFWGYASYWEDHAYIGVLPLLLALSTLPMGLRKKKAPSSWDSARLRVFLWLITLAAFALALGKFTPLFPFLYRHVPTFALFQAPARYLIWADFSLILLAACGIDRWTCPTGRGLYWLRLATAGGFAVTLGAGIAWVYLTSVNLTFVRATALAGVWMLGTGGLTLLIPTAEKYSRCKVWEAAVTVWVLADLLTAAWFLTPTTQVSFYQTAPEQTTQSMPPTGGGRVYLRSTEEYDLKFRRFLRFKDFLPLEDWANMRGALLPNMNLLDQIASVNNFDPLVPGRTARWMEVYETLPVEKRTVFLQMMGVGWLEHIDRSQPDGVRFDPLAGSSLAWWFGCAVSARDEEQAVQLLQATDGKEPVLVVENGAAPGCFQSSPVPIQTVKMSPNRVEIELKDVKEGWVFLAMTRYPGWRVKLDDQDVQSKAANVAFQAVRVPAGSHSLIFIYLPLWFYIGGLLSILGTIFILTLRFFERKRR